ncbi:MAG: c-type cytochrome [Proteobacteria bacterium]|nr:c-type cytochrome [Pseudomonadota bacterium]MDA1326334.1 c-type cytochrome [Pseudomonadota bacterium]
MRRLTQIRRLLAFGLAAAAIWPAPAVSGDTPLSKIVESCAVCHALDGNSRTEKIPSLAGQPNFFLLDQLIFIREGVRPVEAMTPFVKNLKDEDFIALAEHYAALPPKASEERVDPARVKRGEALALRLRCASCHLPSLAGQEQIPRLAKQRIDYMYQVMKDYRDSRRKGGDSIMAATVYGISDVDLLALAHYAASR